MEFRRVLFRSENRAARRGVRMCICSVEGWDGFFFIAHVHERRRAIAHSFQKKIECEGKGHGADTGGEGQEQPCLLSKGWSGCGDDGGKPRGYRGHFNETHKIGRASCRERVCQYV